MDPMSLAEEERRLKEEAEFKELSNTVFLSEGYFTSRDLSKKGRDVHPAGKQAKEIQVMAKTIKFSNQVQVDNYDENIAEFNLTAKPRIFICSGFISRREPDKILRKVTRKFMFLFNDLIIITLKKDNQELYEAQQMLWVKDLRIKHFLQEEGGEDNSLSFELLVNKTRNRPKYSIIFTCDNEDSKKGWITDIENTLLAYHRDTPFSKQLGWYHDIIQGTFWSSAYLGDHTSMRKHLKLMSYRGISIDVIDESGMSGLHWAVFKGHEVCTRLLLDRGADVDILQGGFNTPLLLAAACGYENIARLLIDRGADIYARNNKDHDAVFMAVVYGHASKGLPWLLQLLNAKGLDLNQSDSHGATPLHLCAQKNLARPVRMLVDSGAEVNAKHGKTQLTPLQMACSHAHPDVETIRSFLDKGAYPNWKDLEGRTAFNLAMNNQHLAAQPPPKPTTDIYSGSSMFVQPGAVMDVNQLLLGGATETDRQSIASSHDGRLRSESASVSAVPVANVAPAGVTSPNNGKWRAMEGTLEKVGDWAVKALPALLEISKKGGRFEEKDLEVLRPSFRAAVMEAHEVWLKKQEPTNFLEFVMIREQSGEDLRLHKEAWLKNNSSSICALCSDAFNMTNRKHHCRACGVLCCDPCSSKRLQLTVIDEPPPGAVTTPTAASTTPMSSSFLSMLSSSSKSSRNSTNLSATPAEKSKEEKQERLCDGCFNRLCHEASQPSPDHFRVKQLKQCALDVIQSIEDLIDSLDDPEGDPNSMQHSVRETQALTRNLEALSLKNGSHSTPSKNRPISSSFSTPNPYQTPPPQHSAKSGEALVDVLKIRDSRLSKSEDFIAKFLEAADGYHKITKKLIEQKTASSRLWGGAT